MPLLKQFLLDESGSTAIEYALILILCSTAMIAALYNARESLNNMINMVGTAMIEALT